MASNGSIRHRNPATSTNSNAKLDSSLPDFANPGNTLAGQNDAALKSDAEAAPQTNTLRLIVCVGGIYLSFLTWGVLQERITTHPYPSPDPTGPPEIFHYPIALNTLQALFACILAYLYTLTLRTPQNPLPILPSPAILPPLTLVALTSALASPFGYASLAHVDYITFILAKSCKLLPVMFLHVTLYRKRYPLAKYGVVLLVTAGVAVFTLHSSAGSKKKSKGSEAGGGSSAYGLVLLSINLLLDGLTNTTQDAIHARFRPYGGAQMMCALNLLATGLMAGYLVLAPWVAGTGMGRFVGVEGGELDGAWGFVKRHPEVGWDVLGFAVLGGVGQVFIFTTLAHFGSLLLVTVTVTRKMLTMMLSVVWFGHALSGMQWVGVGLVFGGVGVESWLNGREKRGKARERKGMEAGKEKGK